jgi:predicted PurR-regulated permease PerM
VSVSPARGTPGNGPFTESAAWRVATRTVLFVFFLLLGIWLVVQLRSVVVQVILAVILAAGMAPLVDWFTVSEQSRRWRWRPPRALVVLLLYVVLIALIGALGALVLPPLLAEIEDLIRRIPTYVSSVEGWLLTLPTRYPFLPAFNVDQDLAGLLQNAASQISGVLSQALVVVRVAISFLSGTFNAILTLILALYITSDSRRIVGYLVSFLPADRQTQAERVAQRIGMRLGGWVRGQLMLSAIIGLVTLLGLSLIGVRYAVLLAIVAAIGEAIPMVGPIVSAVPAIVIAFIYSPQQGFLTLGLYILIQQLENHLIVPRVMSRAVELHPLVVILALLAGSELLGVTGAILSVPVAAALSVVVDEIRRQRLRLDENGEVASAPPSRVA